MMSKFCLDFFSLNAFREDSPRQDVATTMVEPAFPTSSLREQACNLRRHLRTWLIGTAVVVSSICHVDLSDADQPFHPFAESMDIDPDYQWFAPVDIQEIEERSPRQKANKGWFVGYDRLHIGFDRPDTREQSSKIDMTWGNRWDFGFMSDSDRGWLFSFTNVSGPNVYDDLRSQRTFGPDPDNAALLPLLRPRFPFDPAYGDGTILLRQSVNVGTLSSFEANKTWRLEPYRYGGYVEPMIGFRYMQFNDYARNDSYFGINTDADPAFEFDGFTRSDTRTDNRMVMGQLGYRYWSSVKRMTFSQEGRFFAGQNFQTQGSATRTFAYEVGTNEPDFFIPTAVFSGKDNSEFVVGFDLRLEAAMQLTRAFNVRAGGQVLYIGRGIWRGANTGFGDQNLNNQSVISPAFTFGAVFNR